MTHITPNQTLFLFNPTQGHSLLNMVHQDEPKEASEPLGTIFVERDTLLHVCSALTREVSKLLMWNQNLQQNLHLSDRDS